LHGEILKARSTSSHLTYPVKGHEINHGDLCENGFQLRPDIVWFGEHVPNMDIAINMCEKADILIVIGTSLNVYPAANLIEFVSNVCKIYLIDPNDIPLWKRKNVTHLKQKASEGLPALVKELLEKK